MLQRYLALLTLCALLSACGAPAQSAGTPRLAATTAPTPEQTQPASGSPAVTAEQPCLRTPAEAPAPADAPARAGAIDARYDSDTHTIVLGKGEQVTLDELARTLDRSELLRELAPGEWLLDAGLEIEEGASLRIAGPAVHWLKLRSDAEGFVALKAMGGDLEIADVCITSWDSRTNRADEQHEDGRSFVLARSGAQMHIANAELRYLGYDANESFGLAWRMAGTSGKLVDSFISHNFYGMYSHTVADLVISGNEVHHNILYGIDPHTGSQRLRIENNLVHNNGKHGIILADACSDGVIRGNTVYNNLHHGIVLYQNSDRNLIEQNRSYNNGAQGININQAAENIVRDNLVYDNLEAGIGVGQKAQDNQLIGNEIRGNREDGIVLYSEAGDTSMRENRISNNLRYGVYIKTSGGAILTNNQISGNRVGVYFKDAEKVELEPGANEIHDNHEGDIQGEEKD